MLGIFIQLTVSSERVAGLVWLHRFLREEYFSAGEHMQILQYSTRGAWSHASPRVISSLQAPQSMYPTLVVVLVASRKSVLEPSVALTMNVSGNMDVEMNPGGMRENASGARCTARLSLEYHSKSFHDAEFGFAESMRPASEYSVHMPSSDGLGQMGDKGTVSCSAP